MGRLVRLASYTAMPVYFSIFVATSSLAAEAGVVVIPVDVGDYRFSPAEIEVTTGQPVQLRLRNTDRIVPHNFTLQDDASGLDLDINLAAGETRIVEFTPRKPGQYLFYCDKKLPFMKSHRKRGMEGTLTVIPAQRE